MRVVIINIINSPIAAFHSDGSLVFEMMEKAIRNEESILLSFEGITQCSTQFLNASVGKTYLQFPSELVDKLISYDFKDLHNLSRKIEEVRDNAIHSKSYDAILEAATM
jgi:hypothetical protein